LRAPCEATVDSPKTNRQPTMQNPSPADPSPAIPAIAALARAIAAFAQTDGDYKTAIPTLSLHRRKGVTAPLHCVFSLGLGVVAQGDKQVLRGSEVVTYGPGQSMLTTIDLPVISHVTRASSQEPLLGLMLTLDSQEIVQTAADMQLPSAGRAGDRRSIGVERLDERLCWDLVRLVELLAQPLLIAQLAPLIKREIVIRLLAGPHGPQLQHLVVVGSPSQQISKAVAWLKDNFARAMRVEELAATVHMSPSTFRHHFRSITGTSPVQYQKQLRLQEARQLMLNQSIDAGSAGAMVGYESPSQFSREYNRLFGSPPQQDVRRMRLTDAVPAAAQGAATLGR
jgi:AraC-like DNA-binding protein